MPDPDLLAALHAERSAFLDALERVPPTDRDRHPAPEAWSPLGIAEHLFRVESGVVRLLAKWVERGTLPDLEAPEPRRLELLERALDGQRRYTVPTGASKAITPSGEVDYGSLRAEWLDAAAEWERLDSALPADWKARPLMRHPMAGTLSWDGILRFLAVHLRHHRAQLDRTLAALG